MMDDETLDKLGAVVESLPGIEGWIKRSSAEVFYRAAVEMAEHGYSLAEIETVLLGLLEAADGEWGGV